MKLPSIKEQLLQTFQILSVTIPALLILTSAIFSFFQAEIVLHLVASPLYVLLWILFILLIVVCPFLLKMKGATLWYYIFTHFPIVLVAILAMLGFATQRSVSIAVREGESVNLLRLGEPFGLSLSSNVSIWLKGFTIEKDPKKITYISDIHLLRRQGQKVTTNAAQIKVNEPFSIEGLTLYQKSWTVGYKNLVFTFRGATHALDDNKRREIPPLFTENSELFTFRAVDVDNNRLLYQYTLQNTAGYITALGYFYSDEATSKGMLYTQFGFSILREESFYYTVWEVAHKPFEVWVGLAGFIALATLSIGLLFKDWVLGQNGGES